MEATDTKKKMVEALRAFDTLMVATNATNGTVHARPMAVAEIDDDGELWFVTAEHSDKIAEISLDAKALVTGQDEHRYVSLSGQLDIIHDRQRIASLWKAAWNTWFPQGPGDESAVLMRLRPAIGEYWIQGSLKGARYFFEATRAMLDGRTPQDEALEHAKVPM
jgi:general stress protein 26